MAQPRNQIDQVTLEVLLPTSTPEPSTGLSGGKEASVRPAHPLQTRPSVSGITHAHELSAGLLSGRRLVSRRECRY